MKSVAVTTEQMLEWTLARLHAHGWPFVDLTRLADAFAAFRWHTSRCVYGVSVQPSLAANLRDAISLDVDRLVAKGLAARSVSRVRMTDKGLAQAFWLKLEQATYGSLADVLDQAFPPRA